MKDGPGSPGLQLDGPIPEFLMRILGTSSPYSRVPIACSTDHHQISPVNICQKIPSDRRQSRHTGQTQRHALHDLSMKSVYSRLEEGRHSGWFLLEGLPHCMEEESIWTSDRIAKLAGVLHHRYNAVQRPQHAATAATW